MSESRSETALDKAAGAEELRKLARELMRLTDSVHDRIGDDGQILGWRGFHIDLDLIEEGVEQMRALVRP